MRDPLARLRESFAIRDRAIQELSTALANESASRRSLRHELDAERAAREVLAETIGNALAAEMQAREALAGRVDNGGADARVSRLEMALRRLEQVGTTSTTAGSAAMQDSAGKDSADPELDPRLYMAIEDQFRGSKELIAERQAPYADRIAAELSEGARVLDIGCGRGEFLEQLRSRGLSPVGVDTNVAAIDEVLAQDLNGVCADAFDYLAAQPDAGLDGAVMFHLVEHMPISATAGLLDLLHRKVRPDGLLVIETPNPENLRVGSHTFWLDPTHVRPVPPILLELLVGFHGFRVIESLRLHPYPEFTEASSPNEAALLGPQDFGLIARRMP